MYQTWQLLSIFCILMPEYAKTQKYTKRASLVAQVFLTDPLDVSRLSPISQSNLF